MIFVKIGRSFIKLVSNRYVPWQNLLYYIIFIITFNKFQKPFDYLLKEIKVAFSINCGDFFINHRNSYKEFYRNKCSFQNAQRRVFRKRVLKFETSMRFTVTPIIKLIWSNLSIGMYRDVACLLWIQAINCVVYDVIFFLKVIRL